MDLASLSPTELGELPEELASAITAEAERDAERTVFFLDYLYAEFARRHPENGPPESYRRPLPATTLFELGSALRILRWEKAGLVRPHMALPEAMKILSDVLRAVDGRVSTLWTDQVLSIFAEHFSWIAAEQAKADLLIECASEDALAEQLAKFLWTNRHLANHQNNEQEHYSTRKSSPLPPSRKQRSK